MYSSRGLSRLHFGTGWLRACGCGGSSEGALVSGAKEPMPKTKNGGARFISVGRNGAVVGDCLSCQSTLS
jgi:hypothetical protein